MLLSSPSRGTWTNTVNRQTLSEIIRTNNCRDAELILAKRVCWQPISTAPKTGREILALVDGRVEIIMWLDTMIQSGWGNRDEYDTHGRVTFLHPDHWMPMP